MRFVYPNHKHNYFNTLNPGCDSQSYHQWRLKVSNRHRTKQKVLWLLNVLSCHWYVKTLNERSQNVSRNHVTTPTLLKYLALVAVEATHPWKKQGHWRVEIKDSLGQNCPHCNLHKFRVLSRIHIHVRWMTLLCQAFSSGQILCRGRCRIKLQCTNWQPRSFTSKQLIPRYLMREPCLQLLAWYVEQAIVIFPCEHRFKTWKFC